MSIRINAELLDRAVNQKIRPILIDRGYLGNPKFEAYHHGKVIPKAGPLLSRKALNDDAAESVLSAINASLNLLSTFEKVKVKDFLKQRKAANEASAQFTSLLYGSGTLTDRVRSFLDWGGVRKTEGKEFGFNATVVSYLLAMSDPNRYAFCKPEIYSAAARALLGENQVETESIARIQHATDFYAAALPMFRDKHHLPFTDLMHCHIAFYVVEKYDEDLPGWEELMKNAPVGTSGSKTETRNQPLNLILYGPPGTGKTWHTIRKAVEICDGTLPDNHAQTHKRFNELREALRIELVTFHQSYGYEEFVEGIRPVLSGEVGEGKVGVSDIRYECRDGVFKRMCTLARGSGTQARRGTQLDLSKQNVWKMSLGDTQRSEEADLYDQCIESGEIRLDYGKGLDFTGCNDRDAVRAKLRSEYPTIEDLDFNIQSVHVFKNRMATGDLVVVSDGNHAFRAIGKITGDYRKTTDDGFSQVRNVEWLLVLEESLPVERILSKVFSQMTIYQLRERVLRLDAFKELLSGEAKPTEKHVLIIDEINRGNISKIFGELITLVEPDKRLGAETELRVTLPYSGQSFGVPSNLFLIGTMNTADRSIAFLDTALRRRFRFEEMMPDSVVIRERVGNNGVIDGVDVAALLESMNRRIELLFDRDHQIGHAYFLNVQTLQDLREVFEYQVIPLLQEYFYGDWAKVCAVLGCPHDPATGDDLADNALPLISVERLDGAETVGADELESRFRYDLNPALFAKDADLALCFGGVLRITAANDQSASPG